LTKITRLVANGCSYMDQYCRSTVQSTIGGHQDLAQRLGIPHTKSLALGGSCNQRIIRTCLKDSYQTLEPTLYIIGLSFLGRVELPIAQHPDEFEGDWVSLQNSISDGSEFQDQISSQDLRGFLNFKLKTEMFSVRDRFEDVAFRLISTLESLQSRGHNALIFQNTDSNPDPDCASWHFLTRKNFVDRLRWTAVPWQIGQGVTCHNDPQVPANMQHIESGHYHVLNDFLYNYIVQHQIII